MKTQGNRTFVGTVVFLDLGEAASASPAPELQQRVRDVVSRTVGHLAETDRLLLDTGQGAVLCFPGDPEDAVFVAIGIRDSLQQELVSFPELHVRLGVNLGPVKVVEEGPGHTQLLGEGLHGAEALLAFASPSQILASRSFFELVSSLSDEYRELFHHRGGRRPGARELDFFELAPVGGAPAAVDMTWPAGATPPQGAVPPPGVKAAAPPAAEPAAAAAPFPSEGGWRPEALAELSGAVAKAMGPLAPVLVKRSVQKTNDPRALCDLLAESITDESDRAAFLAFARRWVSAARKSSPPGPSAAAPAPGRLNPEERARLEAALAPHVGPIAKVLVERVAHEAPDLAAASKKLANSIADGESRKTFLKTLTMVQNGPVRAGGAAGAPAAPALASKTGTKRAPPVGGTAPLAATAFLEEAVLQQAEQSLVRAVGPMARALVRRAAKSARSADELYAALAEELPEGPERERFLATHGRG